jgi:GTPase SAR1 family protein
MKSSTFDIKVAFLGHVSAGKSTLVNAVLHDKYAEVTIGRTTVDVNLFRIFSPGVVVHSLPTTVEETTTEGTKDSISITNDDNHEDEDACTDEVTASTVWSVGPDDHLLAAEQTLQAISVDNAVVTHPKGTTVQETTFDIAPRRDILGDMRHDTKLVLVDIPGVNDVGSTDRYVNYVNDNWDTLDCVVVVLDVFQSVQEQAALLHLVQENLATNKDIPIIIVCNKVDDPSNEEVAVLVEQHRTQVNNMFDDPSKFTFTCHSYTPFVGFGWICISNFVPISKFQNGHACFFWGLVFIPMSSDFAFVYRTASNLTYEKFLGLDMVLIDKICMDEVGRSKWREMSHECKLETAYKAVTSKTTLQKNMDATNFQTFFLALNQCVGGNEAQLKVIQKQLSVSLKRLQTFGETTVDEIRNVISIRDRLGIEGDIHFSTHFWDAYKLHIVKATELYKADMDLQNFYLAMSQLIEYHAVLMQVGPNASECGKVVNEMISLIRIQVNGLLKYAESWPKDCSIFSEKPKEKDCIYYDSQADQWDLVTRHITVTDKYRGVAKDKPLYDNAHHWEHIRVGVWKNKYTMEEIISKHNPVSEKEIWYDLSLLDFKVALESILLLSYNKTFCLKLGPEKLRMDSFIRKFDILKERYLTGEDFAHFHHEFYTLFDCISGECNDDGEFVPKNVDRHDVFVHVKMSDEISNPEHWGHLTWKFCEFMDQAYP